MPDIAQNKPITKAQIKSIHVALSRHRIDDATYRAKLDVMFGVGSCKQLSRRDASVLLKSLGYKLGYQVQNCAKFGHPAPPNPRTRGARGVASTPPNAKKLPAGVVALPSPAQQRFIADLVSEVDWHVEGGYFRWLKKNMSLTRVATAAQAARVIEGLKALKAHQQLKIEN